MKKKNAVKKTTVGAIHDDVLAYTAGKDVVLDLALVEADCLGSAAHATMLSKMPVKPALFSKSDVKAIIEALVDIMKKSAAGTFAITLEDQDVHLAVERNLTAKLGDLGKKIHTGRSRNDQVALDLRLFARGQLLDLLEEVVQLGSVLMEMGQVHAMVAMGGRT